MDCSKNSRGSLNVRDNGCKTTEHVITVTFKRSRYAHVCDRSRNIEIKINNSVNAVNTDNNGR